MPCPICDEKPINCQCTEAELRMYYEIEELEEKVPRWIPVTERLPDTPDMVLAYSGGIIECAWCNKGMWSWIAMLGHFEPTHWMPLPDPPEES